MILPLLMSAFAPISIAILFYPLVISLFFVMRFMHPCGVGLTRFFPWFLISLATISNSIWYEWHFVNVFLGAWGYWNLMIYLDTTRDNSSRSGAHPRWKVVKGIILQTMIPVIVSTVSAFLNFQKHSSDYLRFLDLELIANVFGLPLIVIFYLAPMNMADLDLDSGWGASTYWGNLLGPILLVTIIGIFWNINTARRRNQLSIDSEEE
jgi:hypothetical protein